MTYASVMACNYPSRIDIDPRVHVGSAERAAVCALTGKIPTVQAYRAQVEVVNKKGVDIYRYMNFDPIAALRAAADTVEI